MVNGRTALPFLEQDGRYWGNPSDDDMAIAELERLRKKGATHIAFAWPAFWWLECYPGLLRHLRTTVRCVLESETLVTFVLR